MSVAEDAMVKATVSEMVAARKNRNCIEVSLDDGTTFTMHRDLLLEFPLAVGQRIDQTLIAGIERLEERRRAMQKAFDLLAIKERSEAEIRKKLLIKGFQPDTVGQVVAKLIADRLVDDARYADEFVRVRLGSRSDGPYKLRRDLMKRGIGRELIDATIKRYADEQQMAVAASQIAHRRWSSLNRYDERTRAKKVFDFLVRRGYSFDLARAVVDELKQDSQSRH